MAGNAGDMLATLSLENKQFLDAMKQASESVDKNTSQISAGFEKMGGLMEAAGSVLASFGIGAGMTKFAEECLNAAAATDKLQAQFKALNGATEETKQTFEAIAGLELTSKFDFEKTLGPAAVHMMELGVSAKQTGQSMIALTDAA